MLEHLQDLPVVFISFFLLFFFVINQRTVTEEWISVLPINLLFINFDYFDVLSCLKTNYCLALNYSVNDSIIYFQ